MKTYLVWAVLVLFCIGCTAEADRIDEDTVIVLPTTATPTPSITPAATAVASSTPTPEWLLYENEFLGYQFLYPSQAQIETLGLTGIPTDEVPEGDEGETWATLQAQLPNNLCVGLGHEAFFVTFVPAEEPYGRYTGPCGITGVGDYEMVPISQTVPIDGQIYTVNGHRLQTMDSGAWVGEWYMVDVGNGVSIHFGSLNEASEADYLADYDIMMEIVGSYQAK